MLFWSYDQLGDQPVNLALNSNLPRPVMPHL